MSFLFRIGGAFNGGKYPTLVEIVFLPSEGKGCRPGTGLESRRRDLPDDFLFDFPLKAFLLLILSDFKFGRLFPQASLL